MLQPCLQADAESDSVCVPLSVSEKRSLFLTCEVTAPWLSSQRNTPESSQESFWSQAFLAS
jgi:hypothetical protein